MAAKCALLEEEILAGHEDLTADKATNARVKLRDSRVANRLSYLKMQNPLRYSDKAVIGHQDLNSNPQRADTEADDAAIAKLVAEFGTIDPKQIQDDIQESFDREEYEARKARKHASEGVEPPVSDVPPKPLRGQQKPRRTQPATIRL